MLIVRLLLCAVGCECVGLRVFEGRDANPDEYPYLVALGSIRQILPLSQNYIDYYRFCTGTLIASSWVLTAAHCVVNNNPGSVWIRYGNMSTPLEDTKTLTPALKLIPHPSYLRKLLLVENNDIALVLIRKILDIKVFARLGAFDHRVLIGKEIQYLGYGLTTRYVSSFKNASIKDKLFRKEPLQVGEGYITDCSNLYWLGRQITTKVTFVCVVPKCNNIAGSAARGDSGGPLFYKQYLVGICHGGSITSLKFSIYNRVDAYIDWMQEVMNQKHHVKIIMIPNLIVPGK